MRLTFAVIGAAIAAAAAFCAIFLIPAAHASTGPVPLNCDRACLEDLVNQYLSALVAHNPQRLPLSADVMYTENDQVLPIGDGFWKTVEGRGNYTHIIADPEFGQVAFMGTMREAGSPLLMSLRLRLELGRITEVETVYFKPGGTGTYPFTTDCDRIENGSHTTNVPRPPNEPLNTINGFALDCLAQFKLGYYFVVQRIHHRRYPVVDAERGIVWTHAVFDQGTVNKGVLSTGEPYTFRGFNRPSSILVNEAFLIENGKIRRVEMVGPGTTYHTNSPWPGNLSGN